MNRPFIILLSIALFTLLPALSFCQTKDLLDRIARTELMNRLMHDEKYDSIVTVGRNVPFRDSLYLYGIEGYMAKAYLEKGDTVKGLACLTHLIEHQGLHDTGNLKYNYGKYKLEGNKRYQEIIRNFDKLYSRYSKDLNVPVLAQCMEIYYTDSRVRNVYNSIHDSVEKKYAEDIMWRSDSMNVINLKDLFRTLGHYPGIREIGPSFTANFNYIVTHLASQLNRDTLYILLRDATLKGEIPNWYGPRMLDKLEEHYGRPLLYGELGYSQDYDGDTYIFEPVQDVEHIDKRRAEFLLPPIYKHSETEKCVFPKGYCRETQKL